MITNPSRANAIRLFSAYSDITALLFWLHGLLPHPLRVLVWRLVLGRLGSSAFIDRGVYFRYPKRVWVGDRVSINRGCEFFPSGRFREGTITLRDHVTIGPNCSFYAAGHDYASYDLPDTAAPIVVEERAWIGASSIILQGVTIGAGAVIGAGSVVTRDIPPSSVAVGNPARVIKERVVAK